PSLRMGALLGFVLGLTLGFAWILLPLAFRDERAR
ncbi:MAG: hypothetical protein JWM35_367, partial [Verrucomicrobia bacterium]|nr:hypothetical protein [Verrucomicrobiota bacterium]